MSSFLHKKKRAAAKVESLGPVTKHNAGRKAYIIIE